MNTRTFFILILLLFVQSGSLWGGECLGDISVPMGKALDYDENGLQFFIDSYRHCQFKEFSRNLVQHLKKEKEGWAQKLSHALSQTFNDFSSALKRVNPSKLPVEESRTPPRLSEIVLESTDLDHFLSSKVSEVRNFKDRALQICGLRGHNQKFECINTSSLKSLHNADDEKRMALKTKVETLYLQTTLDEESCSLISLMSVLLKEKSYLKSLDQCFADYYEKKDYPQPAVAANVLTAFSKLSPAELPLLLQRILKKNRWEDLESFSMAIDPQEMPLPVLLFFKEQPRTLAIPSSTDPSKTISIQNHLFMVYQRHQERLEFLGKCQREGSLHFIDGPAFLRYYPDGPYASWLSNQTPVSVTKRWKGWAQIKTNLSTNGFLWTSNLNLIPAVQKQ